MRLPFQVVILSPRLLSPSRSMIFVRLLLVLICLLLWQYDEVEAGTQDRGSREVIRKYISPRMTIITTLPYKSYGIEVAIKTY